MKKENLALGFLFLLSLKKFFFDDKKVPLVLKDIVGALMVHPTKNYNTRTLDKIKIIKIHHSAAEQTAFNYATYHVKSKGWPGIGYHVVIEADGTPYLTNYFETVSYHAQGQNTKSIGVCLSGNFDIRKPSTAQLKTLDLVVKELSVYFPSDIKIEGHKDNAQTNTSCPGQYLYNYIKKYK